MFIALRDCEYDEDDGGRQSSAAVQAVVTPAAADGAAPATETAKAASMLPEAMPAAAALPELDFDALDRAAEAHIAQSTASRTKKKRGRPSGRYSQTVSPNKRGRSSMPPAPSKRPSIFDEQVVRSKSLDEVILSYLADDPVDDKRRS
jgi:hypothetical protein